MALVRLMEKFMSQTLPVMGPAEGSTTDEELSEDESLGGVCGLTA